MKKILPILCLLFFNTNLFSQNINDLIQKADSLVEIKNYKNAINEYSKAIQLDSNNAELFFFR